MLRRVVAHYFADLCFVMSCLISELVRFGAVDLLVALVTDSRELTASSAATALANMAPIEQIRADIIRLRGVSTLIGAAAKTR